MHAKGRKYMSLANVSLTPGLENIETPNICMGEQVFNMIQYMYPLCQQLVLGGMEKLCPFLRSIESHFLECQSKSEQVLPPFRHEPPICRPSD